MDAASVGPARAVSVLRTLGDPDGQLAQTFQPFPLSTHYGVHSYAPTPTSAREFNDMTYPRIGLLAAITLVLAAFGCSDSSDGRKDAGADADGGADGGGSGGDGDSAGDGDSGGDGDAINFGDGGPVGCGKTPFASNAIPVQLMLVVDASGSMDQPTVADANVTSWQALSNALDSALSGVQAEVDMGLQLYPADGTQCDVPGDNGADVAIADGTTAHPSIVSTMNARTPAGGTPTAAALARARRYFTQGAGMALTGDRVVLLATDGGPNCNANITCTADTCTSNLTKQPNCDVDMGMGNCCDEGIHPDLALSCLDDSATIAEVEALAAAGIRTLVVGIPGSEAFRDILEAMAVAGGGSDGYFEVDAAQNVSQLTALLRGITEGLITSCKLRLASLPPDLDNINVEIDGETIRQTGDDGWELDRDTSPPTVIIKGATCAALEADGAKTVDIIYGCPTVE